ncbi:flagellar biosynthetic protein FliO [Ancylobacter terrae]|uniref:flagellar biosynthetic protein FliO n=1 Tax=Ancylobacter sp. sgz301288 TaxID=3342077 RepID=UPI00385DA94A
MPDSVFAFLTWDWGLKALLGLVVLVGVISLLRLTARRRSHSQPGGRHGNERRLAVLDQVAIDERQRLVLIRRDDVEHLLIIGGASPVVVESRIGYPAVAAPTVPMPERTDTRPAQAARAGTPAPAAAAPVLAAAPSLDVVARERVAAPDPERVRRDLEQERAGATRAALAPSPPAPLAAAATTTPSPRGVGRLFAGLAGRAAAAPSGAAHATPAPAVRLEPQDTVAAPAIARNTPVAGAPTAPELRAIDPARATPAPDAVPEPRIAVKVDPEFAGMAGLIEESLRRPLSSVPDVVPEPSSARAGASKPTASPPPIEPTGRATEALPASSSASPPAGPSERSADESVLPNLEAEMADLLGRAPAR